MPNIERTEPRTKYTDLEAARRLGVDILEQLGIDPHVVRGFSLAFRLDEVPILTVSYVMPPVDNGQLRPSTFREFHLVPNDD